MLRGLTTNCYCPIVQRHVPGGQRPAYGLFFQFVSLRVKVGRNEEPHYLTLPCELHGFCFLLDFNNLLEHWVVNLSNGMGRKGRDG